MKKRFFVLLLLCLLLSGCSHRHSWQEASCTAPRCCTACGETEGEPLGHEWQEADCTEAKRCLRCGETEGEPLGHAFTEPNYQDASVCTRCGAAGESVLTPAFERFGLCCTAGSGVSCEYVTCTREDSGVSVRGQVTFTELPAEGKPVNLEELEGYEWRCVGISMSFGGRDALLKGVRWSCVDEDYYDIELHDASCFALDGGSDGFTVNFHGVDYPDCVRSYEYDNGHWDANIYYVDCVEWFRIPVGYDGVVVGVRDAAMPWVEGGHIYDAVNENAVFFRLQ